MRVEVPFSAPGLLPRVTKHSVSVATGKAAKQKGLKPNQIPTAIPRQTRRAVNLLQLVIALQIEIVLFFVSILKERGTAGAVSHD